MNFGTVIVAGITRSENNKNESMYTNEMWVRDSRKALSAHTSFKLRLNLANLHQSISRLCTRSTSNGVVSIMGALAITHLAVQFYA